MHKLHEMMRWLLPTTQPRWERRLRKLLDSGRVEEAHRYLESLKSPPPDIQWHKILILTRKHEWREAKELLDEIASESENYRSVYLYAVRGLCSHQLNQIGEAEKDYEKALRARDDSVPHVTLIKPGPEECCAFILACLAMQLKRWREALDHWTDVLNEHPKHEFGHAQMALLLAGAPDSSVRNSKQSLLHAALAGKDSWAKYSLFAAGYAEAGDFDQALFWARKAYETAPEDEKANLKARIEQYQRGEPFRLGEVRTDSGVS